MTPGQVANGIAAAVAALGAMSFFFSYALLARWWKSVEGRSLMLAAGGLWTVCLLSATLTLLKATDHPAEWLRFVGASLVGMVGLGFIFLTIQVWRAQLNRRHRR
jgi:hypothetical protein